MSLTLSWQSLPIIQRDMWSNLKTQSWKNRSADGKGGNATILREEASEALDTPRESIRTKLVLLDVPCVLQVNRFKWLCSVNYSSKDIALRSVGA
jgi:hypothetical protein